MKEVNVQFINEKTKNAFEDTEDPLKKSLERAFDDIKKSPFCGIQIPKKIIPKEYIKRYNVQNLWKYNLPDAWRLLYSIQGGEIVIFAILLEWLDHKNYERRFNY